MKGRTVRPRYPLNPTAPWLAALLGVVYISAVAYKPLTRVVRTGDIQVEPFLSLFVFVPVFVLAIRYAKAYVELRDDAVLIHGIFTQRIPLERIQSISIVLPGVWESSHWDQYISALVRTVHGQIGQRWIKGRAIIAGYLLVLQVDNQTIAIEFSSDPSPIVQELEKRLVVARSVKESQPLCQSPDLSE